MALSRSTKIWLIVLAIPLLLIIGGAVALKLIFTGDRLKGYVIPAIEEATGRTVTIADVSLSVFPSIAVEVDTLTISNAPGDGFSQRPFCRLDRLVLDVNLFPLLSGRVEVPTILLERPVLLLEVNKNGTANYEFKKDEEPPPAADTVGMTGSGLVLSAFQIENGTLEYVDHEQNSSTKLEGIRLDTEIDLDQHANSATVVLEATVDGFSYGSVESPMLSGIPVSLSQRLTYLEMEDSLSLDEGKATVGTIPLTISGTVAAMSKAPRVDIAIRSAGAKIPDLLSLVPKEYLKDAEGFEGTGTAEIGITMKGVISDSTQPDVTGMISSTGAQVRYGSLPKPITNITIVADFARTAAKQEFRVTKFSANLGDNPIGGTVTVVNFDDPAMNLAFHASLNLAEVKEYYPLEEGTELSGHLKADVKVSGRINDPKTRKSSGILDLKSVSAKTAGNPNPVRNLNGAITFNDQTIEAKKLTMMVGKSDLDIAFTVKNYLGIFSDETQKAKPSATLRLTSNHILTADLITDDEENKSGGTAEKEKGGGLPFPGVSMDITASIGKLTMEKFELTNVARSNEYRGGSCDAPEFFRQCV